MSISTMSQLKTELPVWQEFASPKKNVQIKMFNTPVPAEKIVNDLAAIEGPVDVYFWYEGTRALPKSGALFMKEQIFAPLYRLKPDAKLCLYSLKAWNFKKSLFQVLPKTSLGKAINRVNRTALECIYSSSFFKYCQEASNNNGLYDYISEELPKKGWLFNLSNTQRKSGITVSAFFNERPSLFDSIKNLDLNFAYSSMQYVEGYYLIQESVKKALTNGLRKIEIAFVLPNDESKYYLDYQKDIEPMLAVDFGRDIEGIEINITFKFFQFGSDLRSRPYIDKEPNAINVQPGEIISYFDYLSSYDFLRQKPFLKDDGSSKTEQKN